MMRTSPYLQPFLNRSLKHLRSFLFQSLMLQLIIFRIQSQITSKTNFFLQSATLLQLMEKEAHSPRRAVRILAISDTHDRHSKIPPLLQTDIFIHSGDFTRRSLKHQFQNFRLFIASIPLPKTHKIVIGGNHDKGLNEKAYEQARRKRLSNKEEVVDPSEEVRLLKECCTFLEHGEVEVEGIRIFGSSHYYGIEKDFAYVKDKAQFAWGSIPKGIDVLVTHIPPHDILDYSKEKKHVGCKILKRRVLEVKPKLHIFGHIHEGYGRVMVEGIEFCNASFLDENNEPVNKPFLIELQARE